MRVILILRNEVSLLRKFYAGTKRFNREVYATVHDIALLLNVSIISDDAHYTLNKIFIACLVTLKKKIVSVNQNRWNQPHQPNNISLTETLQDQRKRQDLSTCIISVIGDERL